MLLRALEVRTEIPSRLACRRQVHLRNHRVVRGPQSRQERHQFCVTGRGVMKLCILDEQTSHGDVGATDDLVTHISLLHHNFEEQAVPLLSMNLIHFHVPTAHELCNAVSHLCLVQ